MAENTLLIGTATLPLIPPLGLDMQGFVNRMKAGEAYGEAMEAGVIVVESCGNRIVIATADFSICPVETAASIRSAIASAADCDQDSVLINFNHSHGLPGFPSAVKLGGQFAYFTVGEHQFANYAVQILASAARIAASRLEPAHMELGRAEVQGLSVNRRERTSDGKTILGWNPSGICDRSVQTAVFKRADGSILVTMVNFACHPVVVGKDVPEYSSDFVGPLRRMIKSVLGGDCLFLQGAAGDILPLEGFFSHKGPEVEFGHKVALKAIEAILNPIDPEPVIEKYDFSSTTPISLYRKIMPPSGSQKSSGVVASAVEMVRLPLLPLPEREEFERELIQRQIQLDLLMKNPDSKVSPNTITYHIHWAQAMLSRIEQGALQNFIGAPLQALRIGNLGISAAPGEVFNEIGLAVKSNSPARLTFYCGYSNGILGYFPTASEYPHGGYEPSLSHRGYGQPSAFAPECESLLTGKGSSLLNSLFQTHSDTD